VCDEINQQLAQSSSAPRRVPDAGGASAGCRVPAPAMGCRQLGESPRSEAFTTSPALAVCSGVCYLAAMCLPRSVQANSWAVQIAVLGLGHTADRPPTLTLGNMLFLRGDE